VPVQPLVNALLAAGCNSLDEQAKALGIHRATAWTIIKNKHKLGCLNQATVSRILANSDTPQSVRVIIEQYLSEKVDIRDTSNMRRKQTGSRKNFDLLHKSARRLPATVPMKNFPIIWKRSA